jgi:hypothetical protein
MTGAIVNIVMGLVLAAAGATGRLVLFGTQSSEALVVAGLALSGFGVFQIWRARSR